MSSLSEDQDAIPEDSLVFQLGEEFLAAQRRGEKPQIASYVAQHPQIANELRELLQTMQMMEALPEDNPAMPDPLAEMKGRQLGDYQLVRLIGKGGMGVVYEAKQLSLQRHVAIKVLRDSSVLGEQGRLRFMQEAKSIAKLHHTNIVPIYETVQEDNVCFFAMQLIDGISIDRFIAACRGDSEGPVPCSTADERRDETMAAPSGSSFGLPGVLPDWVELGHPIQQNDAVKMVIQAARALHHAHQRGIIHRDVKPSNLILDHQGVVWLTDFGLAKTEQDNLTATGDLLGTLRYMSPERFQGRCDARADIYALGLTLYELLVLRPAFGPNDRLKLIEAILNSEPAALRTIDAKIPRDLETIVLKATSVIPDQRFESARDFADDLERFLNDEPIQARPPSVREKLVRWTRRNRLVASLLTLLFLVLALTSVTMSNAYFSQRQLTIQKTAETVRANRASQKATELLSLAESRGKELRQRLYSAEMQQASGLLRDPLGVEMVREKLLPWEVTDPSSEPDLRGWEWYFLQSVTHQYARRIQTDDVHLTGVEWLESSRVFAAGSVMDASFWELMDDGHSRQAVVPTGAYTNASAYHPQEGCIAITLLTRGINLVLLDAKTEQIRWAAQTPFDRIHSLTWHPTKFLLSGVYDRNWIVWSGIDGQVVNTGEMKESIQNLAWNSDGHLVISSVEGSETWDVELGERIKTPLDENRWIAFDPKDRCRISLTPGNATVERKNRDGTWNRHDIANCEQASISPDAQWLATSDREGTLKVWHTETGRLVRTLIGHAGQVNAIRWDASSKKILTGADDGAFCIWDLDRLPTIRRHTIGDTRCRFALDGSYLVTDVQGELLVSDLKGNVTKAVGPVDLRSRSMTFNLDGTSVAIGGEDGNVHIWDISEERSKMDSRIRVPNSLTINQLAYLRNGKQLITCSGENGVHIVDIASGESVFTFVGHGSGVFDLSRHPQSDWVVTAGSNGEAIIWHASDGRIRHRLRGHVGFVTSVAWSPDGKFVVSGGENGEVLLWDAESGDLLRRFLGHTRRATGLCWAPDGKRFASVGEDQRLRIWNPNVDRELLNYELTQLDGQRVDWSADGRVLVIAGKAGSILLDARSAYSD